MDGPKPNDIARSLNALALMNMQDIASADINSDLVNDYFITWPIANDESDSDLSELTTYSWKSLLLFACWTLYFSLLTIFIYLFTYLFTCMYTPMNIIF